LTGVVIGVFSAPGGTGKTTISLVLGWLLRRAGNKVLLVDLDPSISLSYLVLRDESKLFEYENRGRCLSRVFERVRKGRSVELEDYVVSGKAIDVEVDILIPDSELTSIIDSLWYGPEARKEYKLRRVLEALGVREAYDFIIIDTIPFFDRKYAILTLYGSDKCIIPLRPTIIDVFRTCKMLSELPALAGKPKKEVFDQVRLLFNMVRRNTAQYWALMRGRYQEIIRGVISPHISFFKKHIPLRVAFSRVSTEEERAEDVRDVEEATLPVLSEFQQWIGRPSEADKAEAME